MKKIIIGLSALTLSINAFAATANNSSVKVGAIPSDTVSANIKVCNFYNDTINWSFNTSSGNAIVAVGSNLVLPSGSCSLVGLRQGLNQPASTVQVNISDELNPGNNASFTLGSLSQFINGSSITKFLKADNFSGYTAQLNTYSPYGWKVVSLVQNPGLQNLSAGVIPDFVLCTGGTQSQCNDSYGTK